MAAEHPAHGRSTGVRYWPLSKAKAMDEEIVEDLSHGPAIMFSVDVTVGYVYVDASRADSDAGAGIEISRTDAATIELTRPEEVDALVTCLEAAKREVWGVTTSGRTGKGCSLRPVVWIGGRLAPVMLRRAHHRHGPPRGLDRWYWNWAARKQQGEK